MKKMFLLSISVVLGIFLFASCGQIELDAEKPVSHREVGFGQSNEPTAEELAMEERYQGQFIMSQDEQLRLLHQHFLNDYLQNHPRVFVGRTESFSLVFDRGFLSYKGEPQVSEIWYQVFILENPDADPEKKYGFALTCGDFRIGDIMAFVPYGDWFDTENGFLNMVKFNMVVGAQERIDSLNQGLCVHTSGFQAGECPCYCCHPCQLEIPPKIRSSSQCNGEERCEEVHKFWKR